MDSTTTQITSTDSLNNIAQQLISLGSTMGEDLKNIITELQGIQIQGDASEIIASSLTQLNSIVNEVALPDVLGKSLLSIIESFTAVDSNVQSLFSDWGGVLSTVTSSLGALGGAISGAYTAVTGTEAYTSMPLLSFFKDTTTTLTTATTDLLTSTNKLVNSYTGNSIAVNVSNLATKAIGTFSTLITGLGSGGTGSVISGLINSIFRR